MVDWYSQDPYSVKIYDIYISNHIHNLLMLKEKIKKQLTVV